MSEREIGRHLPLKTDALLVLVVLLREDLHGYGIIREVEERSNGEIQLQTGALYRLLKHLLADGLIREVEAPRQVRGDPRRFYRTTPLGAQVVDAEVERLSKLVRAVRQARAGLRPRFT